MVPHTSEVDSPVPHRSFKIKANFGTLRIGFVEPTIWKTWRKSGRINADAERFMVSRAVPCRQLNSALG
jgi:amidase